MLKKLSNLLLHLVMLAVVCVIAAYWVMKIVTPPPGAPPPPMAASAPREADPVLAARMFGLVQTAPVVAANVQVIGVFSAGKDSAAILAAEGRPARVVLIGQTVSAGTRLADVRPDGVTLDSNGARQELKLPLRAPVALGGGPPRPAGFTRDGNTLTAPGLAGPAVAAPARSALAAPAPDGQIPRVPGGAFPVPNPAPPPPSEEDQVTPSAGRALQAR